MSIANKIERIIKDNLNPVGFELINESDRHIGHAGHDGSGESHFKLIVVSSCFEGMTRVQMQKTVYNLLDSVFKDGLHALSLSLKSPSK